MQMESRLGGGGRRLRPLAHERQELLGPAALVALHVLEDRDLARWLGVRERDIGQRVPVLAGSCARGKNRDSRASRNERLDGRNLGASGPDPGLEVVVAA